MKLRASTPATAVDRDAWKTPQPLWEYLNRIFHFYCDCAATPENAKCAMYITPEQNALQMGWSLHGTCWLNPPFSMLPEFTDAIVRNVERGCRVVAIVPGHRCEQDWWRQNVLGKAAHIAYPRGRVAYDPPPGAPASSPEFPSVILVYGPRVQHTFAVPLEQLAHVYGDAS